MNVFKSIRWNREENRVLYYSCLIEIVCLVKNIFPWKNGKISNFFLFNVSTLTIANEWYRAYTSKDQLTFIFRFVEFNKIDRKQICKRYLHDYLHGCNHLGDFTSKFTDANISRINWKFFPFGKSAAIIYPPNRFSPRYRWRKAYLCRISRRLCPIYIYV